MYETIQIELTARLLRAIDICRDELSRSEFIEMVMTAMISPDILDGMGVWSV